jgi:LmbE family N-acetylglucosaminyl deacetylase
MKVLAIAAHPDDELFTAGMLAKYASEGHDVYILWTTRGEGGSPGKPPVCQQSDLGIFREQEARASGASLGAREVFFLPYIDPLWDAVNKRGFHIDAPLEEFSAALWGVITRLRPQVILTHGSNGEYGHPQHIYTHQAVFQVLHQMQPWKPKHVFTWNAAYRHPDLPETINHDDPADTLLDLRPWLARKLTAWDAHHSQHYDLESDYPGRPLTLFPAHVESFHRWVEMGEGKVE